jgi:hypothetical protein
MRRSGRGSNLFRLTVARRRRLFTFDSSAGWSKRTVFPCTKSAMNVGGSVARCGWLKCRNEHGGVWVNKGTATYFADGMFTRGRPDEPSSTVSGV